MKSAQEVEKFWNENPCGASAYFSGSAKRDAFTAIEKERYAKQDKIAAYASFGSYKGKRVLEIGCGIGSDGIQFARAGAFYTGVDVTEAAVAISRERFELFNQKGEFIKINAEKLPFADGSFDYVYSFGVIHHSPCPEKIVSEINRVLKPGGKITVMLYNRSSFYYLLEVSILRKLFFSICDKKRLCGKLFGIFGKRHAMRFESYREKLARYKSINGKPSSEEWISMNTDDVFCPISRVYSAGQSRRLFTDFKNFKTTVWFIDKDNWFLWFVFGKFIPRGLYRILENHSGWFRMIQADKA
ncbi:MAG TPA: methyltransferase domain-containing protein [Candidatus Omnitrophota bacterium]|nr:methyltransferase domain-containing protein [Candidatus Omnitrophota bacterium]